MSEKWMLHLSITSSSFSSFSYIFFRIERFNITKSKESDHQYFSHILLLRILDIRMFKKF